MKNNTKIKLMRLSLLGITILKYSVVIFGFYCLIKLIEGGLK